MEESWQLPGIEPRAPGFISLRQQVLMEKSLWLTPNKTLAADTEWLLNWVIQCHLCSTRGELLGTSGWLVSYLSGKALVGMVRCPGFKISCNWFLLSLIFASQHKSRYSSHTCITLGIIVLYSGIGETDATLKVVSAQTIYIPTRHRTINMVVSCSKWRHWKQRMRNLKNSRARKSQRLVSTHAALRNHKLQTVSTDNFIVQDSYQIVLLKVCTNLVLSDWLLEGQLATVIYSDSAT